MGVIADTVRIDHGRLVVFEVRPGKTWDDRLWSREAATSDGKRIVVLGG